MADPRWDRGWHKVEYGRGPPPWAPAHGYRHKRHGDHDGDDETRVTRYYEYREQDRLVPVPVYVERVQRAPMYVAPYGINAGRCNRELLGSLIGGAVGGIAGSHVGRGNGRTAAIIGGAVLGVLVGGSIGHNMDLVDQACVNQVLEYAPTTRHVAWQNPDNGARYDVTPLGTYATQQGQYCREYLTTATIGGPRTQVYGTACRQPDGSWQIIQ